MAAIPKRATTVTCEQRMQQKLRDNRGGAVHGSSAGEPAEGVNLSNVIEVEGKRYYQTDAGPLPSVHVVLEATAAPRLGLEIYRARVGEETADFTREVAAKRGRETEEAVARFMLEGVEPDATSPIRPFWDSLAAEVRKIVADAVPGTLELQVQVVGEIDRYAGTLDLRYRSQQDGRRKIVDWKTSSTRDKKTGKTKTKSRRDMADQLAQVAAYVEADAEQTGERADGRVILGIPDRPARTYDVDDNDVAGWRERIARFWAMQEHDDRAPMTDTELAFERDYDGDM